jgi:predicted esterase
MKQIKVSFLLILVYLSLTISQPSIVALFTAESHTYAGTTIPYRLYVPQNPVSGQVYPLVLALHGSGERGSDNLIHIQSHRLATSWADPVNQANYPCFVVAPQCPLNRNWVYSFRGPIGSELATVVDLIDSLLTVFPVDSNRLYVTGLSMGGFGTWDLIQRFPDKFAAAIPMSAGGDPSQIENISHVPIWNFHGKLDNVVPVSFSRDMMIALENAGSPVVYTHCKYENCTGLADSTINMLIHSHALHFYTEYKNGQHANWAQSYDYPPLFPWVFSKYRTIQNSINLTNLNNYRSLTLAEDITWTALNQEGSVELWFSPDLGESWDILNYSAPNSGTYTWNTELVNDCAFGLLKILPKNNQGFIYGNSVSSPFAINNSQNGTPFVKILNDQFDKGLILSEDTLQLDLLLGDPEQNNLLTTINYSADLGENFEVAGSFMRPSDTLTQRITINVNPLANSNNAVIKVSANDGQNNGEDQTFHFVKQSTRHSSFSASHVAGEGDARVNIQIIDPSQLTGDLYRVSFNDSNFSYKVYDIFDVTTGQYAVQNAAELDGFTEGPLFDGIRLVIMDFDPPVVNYQQTGWQNSTTTLELTVYLPEIDMGTYILYGIPYAADYLITISDFISDTSSTAFGAPPIPMKFTVQNITENQPAEVIFLDNDNNNQLSLADELYFIETDSTGNPALAWAIHVSGNSNPILPVAGDQFLLKTFKPVSNADIFEFRGDISPILTKTVRSDKFQLFNNYPNPFNPRTTIKFELLQKSYITIKIYNILGEEVATLVSGLLQAGSYQYIWDARGSATGIYMCRFQAGDYVETRKMVLMR